VEKAVHRAVSDRVDFVPIWGSTLHHLEDLPYTPGESMPNTYTAFRKASAAAGVRKCVPTPVKGELPGIKDPSEFEKMSIEFTPDLKTTFGFSEEQVKAAEYDKRSSYPFKGGEQAGLGRLKEFLFTKKAVGYYKETRNNLMGANYSSKLSPWLANGTLSVRQIYHETRRFEKENSVNESSTHFVDELYWRDFCRFWFMHYAGRAFSAYGV